MAHCGSGCRVRVGISSTRVCRNVGSLRYGTFVLSQSGAYAGRTKVLLLLR
jgi:hypothetical protein